MKLSDYVMQFIADQGVKHVFMLPGGGAMHLNDSLGRCKDIQYVCNLHEQASAVAAESYAKVTNNLGVAMVTSGPGGTNAITGLAGAWLDSTPCLFLSGQVKRADLKGATGVRILGSQEIDIVSLVSSITKYAVTIIEPNDVRYHLEKAVHLARTGRRGPAWLDFPLDVQAAQVDAATMRSFHPASETNNSTAAKPSATEYQNLQRDVTKALTMLRQAERPVILAGHGIHSAGARRDFMQLVEALRIPVLTTWLAIDLIAEDHPLYAGRPGAIAPRGANFALQNSDYLLVIGARMDMALTAYAHDKLARAAKKIMVDIDPSEIAKMKTPIHLPVVADAGDFIREMLRQAKESAPKPVTIWTARCLDWKKRYPVVQDAHRNRPDHQLSVYHFSDVLTEELDADDVIAPGSSGFACEIFFLVFKTKYGQRVLHNRGTGSMGIGLPSAIGACFASGKRRTICVDGDGGFQMNIQELATVAHHQLPIKFFVVNNQGFASIRTSQTAYFDGRLVGADANSGMTLPDVLKVAAAYGVPTARLSEPKDLRQRVAEILRQPGPVVCEVIVPPDEPRGPRVSSMQKPDGTMISKPLEDLWPFLSREEFLSNMIIPPLPE